MFGGRGAVECAIWQPEAREWGREWGGVYQKRSELAGPVQAASVWRRDGTGEATHGFMISRVQQHLHTPDTVFSGNVNTPESNSATSNTRHKRTLRVEILCDVTPYSPVDKYYCCRGR